MLVVSAIFASTTYVDAILHLTGVLEREEVQFWGTVMFFSNFLIQAIILTYWTQGGLMYIDRGNRTIRLLDEGDSDDEHGEN